MRLKSGSINIRTRQISTIRAFSTPRIWSRRSDYYDDSDVPDMDALDARRRACGRLAVCFRRVAWLSPGCGDDDPMSCWIHGSRSCPVDCAFHAMEQVIACRRRCDRLYCFRVVGLGGDAVDGWSLMTKSLRL